MAASAWFGASMTGRGYRERAVAPRTVTAMCGRFVSSSAPDEIARYFDADETSEQALEHQPNFNTAPTTDVFVVDTRTNVTIYTKANDANDHAAAPRLQAVLSDGTNILSATANGLHPVPYSVDQGVKVFLTGANVETNHVVVTVLYRK